MTEMDSWIQARRLTGLRRFALAITILNILGHTVFGFEQSWIQPLLSLATAYSCELFAEWIDSRADGRQPRFLGGWRKFVDYLLPAHITGLAVAMLLYSGDRVLPTVFASAVAIASKTTFRVTNRGRLCHFLNPSNFGITITLLVFPWVSIAPPYQFTENLNRAGSLILPAIIFITGTFMNLRITGRVPLILSWWAGFVGQAAIRSALFGTSLAGALNPMTGVAFVLFSFYMISDPATTPFATRKQIFFGLSVASAYGLLVSLHISFGLFFALTSVCLVRGLLQYVTNLGRATLKVELPAVVSPSVTPVREHA
jgi:enediyne biosynthesis protein E5